MGNLPNEEAGWLDDALKALPAATVSGALQQRILASFETVAARRNAGFGNAIRRFAAAIWPGAPAWRPAVALAFSLLVGLVAGTLVPLENAFADGSAQTANISLDAPPPFDLDENS